MELDLQRDDLSFEHWDSGLVASRVADWDVSGYLNVGDVFAFLGDFFAGSADVDGDEASTATDVFAFLTDYLTPE